MKRKDLKIKDEVWFRNRNDRCVVGRIRSLGFMYVAIEYKENIIDDFGTTLYYNNIVEDIEYCDIYEKYK